MVEYRSTQTKNSAWKRCNILSRSTPTKFTRSRQRMRSNPDASCASKEWFPRTERISEERDAPSSHTIQKRAAKIAESFARIATVPIESTTYRGGRGGPGSNM